MDLSTLYSLGVGLIFAGTLVLLIAIFLLFISNAKGKEKLKGGGVIIVGPFPIILGTDKQSVKTILLLSILLTVLLVIAMVTFYLISR
jgi:uncharacterized protein (TIGR00304 family)